MSQRRQIYVSNYTTLRKSRNWAGQIAADNGELRFYLADQSFPSNYQASVDVSNVGEPDSSTSACVGFALHTNAGGTTFEELAICPGVKYSLIKVLDGREIYRDDRPFVSSSSTFHLKAEVTASTTTFTVDDTKGTTATLNASVISSPTSYIGLTIFWKSAGATATFSNFSYSGNTNN
jgi:hypothetical protein